MNFAICYIFAFIGGYILGGSIQEYRLRDREEKIIIAKDQLTELSNELEEYAEELNRRNKEIKEKWQSMVVDFSKYQAELNGSEKWTESDDIYLNSWKSAEE